MSDSDNTIKFHCAEGGEISTANGDTIFSNLFMLGAFSLTRKYDGQSLCNKYQTDAEGLKVLESKSGEAVELLSDAVAVLGVMLSHVDHRELASHQLNTYAWLVAGLGELIGMAATENSDVQYALTQLNHMNRP